jgi:hypothetical protein
VVVVNDVSVKEQAQAQAQAQAPEETLTAAAVASAAARRGGNTDEDVEGGEGEGEGFSGRSHSNNNSNSNPLVLSGTFSTSMLPAATAGDSLKPPAAATNLRAVFTSRTFVNATWVSAIAQILMLIMMISSILKMADLGFTLVEQSLVLDFHFLAMFGTGFVTNHLLKMYGVYNGIVIAWALLALALVFFMSSQSLWSFFLGDILVGASWNILFSTGTVMLSFCYLPRDRHVVQSVFEIIINSVSGVFSIVSGVILSRYGWSHVLYGMLGIFAALSVSAPLYAMFFADPSSTFDTLSAPQQHEHDTRPHSKSNSNSKNNSNRSSTDHGNGNGNGNGEVLHTQSALHA